MRKQAYFLCVILGIFISTCSAAFAKTIKIGILTPLSGVYSNLGDQNKKGWTLKMKEIGYKVGRHEIQVIWEDTETKPAAAVTKIRKLVEKDRVDLTLGGHFSSVALALRDFVHQAEIPHITLGGATTMQLSYEKKSPYFYRSATATGQFSIGLAEYLTSNGLKKASVMVPDYSYGHDLLKFYTNDFKIHGGEVIQKILVPFPTLDFAPYLAKVDPGADVLISEHSGADAVRLVKQFKQYGMWNKMPLCGGAIILQEMLEGEGDAALGIRGAMFYSSEIDTPNNKKYVKAYMDEYKELPGGVSAAAYDAATAFVMALQEIDEDIDNFPDIRAFREAYLKAIKNVMFIGLRGPFRYEEETHSAMHDNYVLEVVKKNGQYVLKVLKTIPSVKVSEIKKLFGD
jgi:branched-chain amino acid transport system substrate-binding protein